MAEIVMDNLGKTLFRNNSHLVKKLCVGRDTLTMCSVYLMVQKWKMEISQFSNLLNILQAKIDFTVEMEDNNSLKFLNLTITK